ncbi:MAG: type II secretion system GspH family protein [Planctomycetaceae bacterium]|jgi:prepilin-type N-terminal cleavage/methylation domain-containing protein|nr:type II secretion system GspH family protein [Planctomycetaceae bacterium]
MSFYFNKQCEGIRRGFTLIELLVVIVIIGILASMAFVGGRAAINATRRGMINVQIKQVDMALETYHQKYGEYPPDFSNEADVLKHIRKRWPKFDWTVPNHDLQGFYQMINDATPTEYKYDFANAGGKDKHFAALAFWLGGMPDTATGMLNGFSADVTNPLSATSQREEPMLELTIGDNCQIVDGIPVLIAYKYPIAYFRSSMGNYLQKGITPATPLKVNAQFSVPEWKTVTTNGNTPDSLGFCVPYAKSGATSDDAIWHNPKRFQLIHPGLDGQFNNGSNNAVDVRVIDATKDIRNANITFADEDNQANFGGTTIDTTGN